MTDRRFPIQGGGTVDWAAAELAYATYAKSVGSGQTLERLAERGGFGIIEFCLLYHGRYRTNPPGWPNPETVARYVLDTVRDLGPRWDLP